MTPYDFVHLSLLAVGGCIRGKTKLQKTLYFLGVLTDVIDDLAYRAHYYGPYSDEVSAAVSRLVSLGFVNQSVGGAAFINESGFEVSRYDYELNDQGRRIAEMKRQQNAELWGKLVDAAKKLEDAGDIDYMKLSMAAKTHFITRKKNRTSLGELVQLAQGFGWSVTKTEIEDSARFLERLELVEIVKAKTK
jgi:uncharacterized protein YwgA